MTSVVLAGPELYYLEGLKSLLEDRSEFAVLSCAVEPRDMLRAVREHRPRALLVDVRISRALESIALVREACTEVKVVALSVLDEKDVCTFAELGVAAFVPHSARFCDLVETLNAMERGELRCTPRAACALLRRVGELANTSASGRLTPREREVLTLVAEGWSNKEIARELRIGLPTVKNHVHNILEKLHVSGRGQAAARLRRGME